MTLYEKRVSSKGRVTYVPVSETEALDGLGEGSWLVLIRPGLRSIRKLLETDNVPILAAMEAAREPMAKAISQCAQPRASQRMSVSERYAYQAYLDAGGEGTLRLEIASAREIVDAGIAAIQSLSETKVRDPND